MRNQVIKNKKAISYKKLCGILRNFFIETYTVEELGQYSKKTNYKEVQCLCEAETFCF